jgi:outer membrane protein OmpA-like peptidoglycan-associated protein
MRALPTILAPALLLLLGPTISQAQPVETELDGVTAEVVELRQAGGILRLAIRFSNAGNAQTDPLPFGIGRISLVDVKSKKKYFPLMDAEKRYVAGPKSDWIDGGRIGLRIPAKGSTVLWAYFEAVTAGTVMNVEVPFTFPFESVPVTEAPSKVLSNSTAKSSPAGAVATVVSATRADQVLNVRLRLTAEPKSSVSLRPYFNYFDVFLFDPAAKRVYSLMKDSEGMFQATPLTVKMDGGSFIPDWGKTTLVSLTFQAPPDSVTKADLLLPYFLPVEGIAIAGLGGAAAGGSAAAGKTLGLEGALKELNAEVTPTEIKIDLAADVLFDFDKASLKKEAEPSLQNLATVLKAHPTAAVAIEGHTDGLGTDAYNQTLSEQRAASVKQWLVANAQVGATTISTRGWGKSKPAVPNTKADGSDDPQGRAKNRRVQVIVRKGG